MRCGDSFLPAMVTVIVFVSCTGRLEAQQEGPCSLVVPGQVFCDDFRDGGISDNDPVSWVRAHNSGELSVDAESLVLSNRTDEALNAFATIAGDPEDVTFAGTSIRAQVRLMDGDYIGVASRRKEGVNSSSYLGFLSADTAGIGIGGHDSATLDEKPIAFDVTQSDVTIQLDVFEDKIDFWAWPLDESMPSVPTLSSDGIGVVEGKISLFAGRILGNNGPVNSAFRYVHVATQSIPEPPTLGDFSGNGVLDAPDIDDLTGQSASGANDLTYDLTGDGLVDSDDVAFWISDATIFNSWVGDLNLDLEFNSTDLTLVLASGVYDNGTPSDWSQGDFNGDGVTDSSDLSAGLASGGYEKGPRTAATAAVPEPSSAALLCIGLMAFVKRFG